MRPKVSSRVSGRAGVLNKKSKSSSQAKRTPEEIIAGLKRSRAARTIQHRLRGPQYTGHRAERESAATTLQASLRISGAKKIANAKRDRQVDMDQARLHQNAGIAQMDALAVIEQWWRARCDVSSFKAAAYARQCYAAQASTIEARWLALHARGWVGLLQLQRSPAVAAMRTVCVALGLDPATCDEAPPYTAAVWQGVSSSAKRSTRWTKAASGSLGGGKQPAGNKLALMMQGVKRGAAAANQAGPQPLLLQRRGEAHKQRRRVEAELLLLGGQLHHAAKLQAAAAAAAAAVAAEAEAAAAAAAIAAEAEAAAAAAAAAAAEAAAAEAAAAEAAEAEAAAAAAAAAEAAEAAIAAEHARAAPMAAELASPESLGAALELLDGVSFEAVGVRVLQPVAAAPVTASKAEAEAVAMPIPSKPGGGGNIRISRRGSRLEVKEPSRAAPPGETARKALVAKLRAMMVKGEARVAAAEAETHRGANLSWGKNVAKNEAMTASAVQVLVTSADQAAADSHKLALRAELLRGGAECAATLEAAAGLPARLWGSAAVMEGELQATLAEAWP